MNRPKLTPPRSRLRDDRQIAVTKGPAATSAVIGDAGDRSQERLDRPGTRAPSDRDNLMYDLVFAGDLEGSVGRGDVATTDALASDGTGEGIDYLGVYRSSPLARISLIKKRIPASDVKRLLADLRMGQGVGLKALNLSTATVNKKAKEGALLSCEESERVIGLAGLVGQLEAIVLESGDPSGFDARGWMGRWLTAPLPAFGGVRPVDLMDTMEGQGLVSSALAKVQSGAYA